MGDPHSGFVSLKSCTTRTGELPQNLSTDASVSRKAPLLHEFSQTTIQPFQVMATNLGGSDSEFMKKLVKDPLTHCRSRLVVDSGYKDEVQIAYDSKERIILARNRLRRKLRSIHRRILSGCASANTACISTEEPPFIDVSSLQPPGESSADLFHHTVGKCRTGSHDSNTLKKAIRRSFTVNSTNPVNTSQSCSLLVQKQIQQLTGLHAATIARYNYFQQRIQQSISTRTKLDNFLQMEVASPASSGSSAASPPFVARCANSAKDFEFGPFSTKKGSHLLSPPSSSRSVSPHFPARLSSPSCAASVDDPCPTGLFEQRPQDHMSSCELDSSATDTSLCQSVPDHMYGGRSLSKAAIPGAKLTEECDDEELLDMAGDAACSAARTRPATLPLKQPRGVVNVCPAWLDSAFPNTGWPILQTLADISPSPNILSSVNLTETSLLESLARTLRSDAVDVETASRQKQYTSRKVSPKEYKSTQDLKESPKSTGEFIRRKRGRPPKFRLDRTSVEPLSVVAHPHSGWEVSQAPPRAVPGVDSNTASCNLVTRRRPMFKRPHSPDLPRKRGRLKREYQDSSWKVTAHRHRRSFRRRLSPMNGVSFALFTSPTPPRPSIPNKQIILVPGFRVWDLLQDTEHPGTPCAGREMEDLSDEFYARLHSKPEYDEQLVYKQIMRTVNRQRFRRKKRHDSTSTAPSPDRAVESIDTTSDAFECGWPLRDLPLDDELMVSILEEDRRWNEVINAPLISSSTHVLKVQPVVENDPVC